MWIPKSVPSGQLRSPTVSAEVATKPVELTSMLNVNELTDYHSGNASSNDCNYFF